MGVLAMDGKQALWFEETGQESFNLVGKKNANLGELTKLGMPVPRGFAVTIKAEEAFLDETGALQTIRDMISQAGDLQNISKQAELSQAIRSMVESKEIPAAMKAEILNDYHELSAKRGKSGAVAVSIRSAGSQSHPGQYETVLSVTGDKQLLSMLKKVWSSIFNKITIAKLVQKGIPIDQSPAIGVGIMEMVNARCAGVGFTIHPISGDVANVIIESTWGIGEGVVGGKINTDRFVVEKASLKIVDRTLGEKKLQVIAGGNRVVEKEVSPEKQAVYTLSEEEAEAIAKIGMELEAHFKEPQDFEWAVDDSWKFPNNIFLLQTRPVVGVKAQKKKTMEEQLDELLERLF
jgi:pyruvate,water dikinase